MILGEGGVAGRAAEDLATEGPLRGQGALVANDAVGDGADAVRFGLRSAADVAAHWVEKDRPKVNLSECPGWRHTSTLDMAWDARLPCDWCGQPGTAHREGRDA